MTKAACQDTQLAAEHFGDAGLLWRVNERRVLEVFRDQALVAAVASRVDARAAAVVRAALALVGAPMEAGEAANCLQSKPVTAIDVQRAMRDSQGMDAATVDKYLSVLLQDSFKVGHLHLSFFFCVWF